VSMRMGESLADEVETITLSFICNHKYQHAAISCVKKKMNCAYLFVCRRLCEQ